MVPSDPFRPPSSPRLGAGGTDAELRLRIVEYLETAEGDILRSVGMIAEGIGAPRPVVRTLIRDMVRKGEVFEPIPRRYLHHERRSNRPDAPPHVPERRRKTGPGR